VSRCTGSAGSIRAVEALRVCVAQNPNFLLAHRRLAMLYANRLKDPKKGEGAPPEIPGRPLRA